MTENAEPATALGRFDPGSFRDRHSHVVVEGGRILRYLDRSAHAEWLALAGTAFFGRAVAAGHLVGTRVADDAGALAEPWRAALEHERIPFVSYPYEWCWGMLRAAAAATLDLLVAALAEGFTLKDGSAYNVQWRGAQPVFIDVGSLVRRRSGEVWTGYRQFCEQFLNPLLLQAYRQVPFQPWLRGRLAGITPGECWAALSMRDLVRPGVLRDVALHSALERSVRPSSDRVGAELADAGFGRGLVLANARRLRRLVGRLRWQPPESAWSGYAADAAHVATDREEKSKLVREVLAERSPRTVWDLGTNDGHFARLAAERASSVVALDADHAVVERLFRQLAAAGERTILPLVVNLADASPGLGWRGRERRRLEERGRPDLVLCLALLHHLVIAAHVPLDEVLEWLADLGGSVVLEYVHPEDAMVEQLLAGRRADFPDYEPEAFERSLAARFEVRQRRPLSSTRRELFVLEPRRP